MGFFCFCLQLKSDEHKDMIPKGDIQLRTEVILHVGGIIQYIFKPKAYIILYFPLIILLILYDHDVTLLGGYMLTCPSYTLSCSMRFWPGSMPFQPKIGSY